MVFWIDNFIARDKKVIITLNRALYARSENICAEQTQCIEPAIGWSDGLSEYSHACPTFTTWDEATNLLTKT